VARHRGLPLEQASRVHARRPEHGGCRIDSLTNESQPLSCTCHQQLVILTIAARRNVRLDTTNAYTSQRSKQVVTAYPGNHNIVCTTRASTSLLSDPKLSLGSDKLKISHTRSSRLNTRLVPYRHIEMRIAPCCTAASQIVQVILILQT
jgi:hypothetical protein